MVQKKIIVTRRVEDKARQIVEFVTMVEQFPCEVFFQIQDSIYSGKSIIGMIAGDCLNQKEIECRCSGEQEEVAMSQIVQWLHPEC